MEIFNEVKLYSTPSNECSNDTNNFVYMWCIVLYVIKKNIEEDFIMWKDQAKKLLRLIAPRKASKCFFGVTGSAEETAFHEPNFLTASDQIGLDFSILYYPHCWTKKS